MDYWCRNTKKPIDFNAEKEDDNEMLQTVSISCTYFKGPQLDVVFAGVQGHLVLEAERPCTPCSGDQDGQPENLRWYDCPLWLSTLT